MKLRSILKPEYVYRPGQILRRVKFQLSTPGEFAEATLPWGMPIRVRPGEIIGRSIASLGIFELQVTEAIWRLADPGETVADVGANIGYMTSVMCRRVRPGGTVWCFEPHPEIFAELGQNVERWRREPGSAKVELRNAAVSDHSGECRLHIPSDFSFNRGLASVEARDGAGMTEITVPQMSLDEVFAGVEKLGLVKVDVEGHEAAVFAGARGLIKGHRVRDWLFEENDENPLGVGRMLSEHGYSLFRIKKHFSHVELAPPEARVTVASYAVPESPNFLATLEPARATQRFAPHGWQCLRR
jgi:FkbM family methyltransferase